MRIDQPQWMLIGMEQNSILDNQRIFLKAVIIMLGKVPSVVERYVDHKFLFINKKEPRLLFL